MLVIEILILDTDADAPKDIIKKMSLSDVIQFIFSLCRPDTTSDRHNLFLSALSHLQVRVLKMDL